MPASRRELTRAQLPIETASQFPSLQPLAAPEKRHRNLTAGLGVVTFVGPHGPGFQKGGHNDSTGNTWVCIEEHKRCVVILSNDARAEALFPRIVKSFLAKPTCRGAGNMVLCAGRGHKSSGLPTGRSMDYP